MRPGMTRQPRQSRTWVSGWEGGPFPFPVSRFPTSTIRPSRTVTSARSTRHAPSCSSTSPPTSSRSGVFGGCCTASGRDARLGAGGVVREVEVDAQLFQEVVVRVDARQDALDRKSTRLNSSHTVISYAVFCLKKKKTDT